MQVLIDGGVRGAVVERARQHDFRKLHLGGRILAGAGVEHVKHQFRIEPSLDAEHHRLGGRRHREIVQHVVDQLDHLRLTRLRPGDEDVRADFFECRTRHLDGFLVARNNDGQRAGCRTRRPSGHGCVDEGDALVLQRLAESCGGLRAAGREVDHALHALRRSDAVLPEQHPFGFLIVGHARENDLGSVGGFGGTVGPLGAVADQRLGACAGAVVDRERQARAEQSRGHWPSHRSGPDERIRGRRHDLPHDE